jgi:hypothetical protein
MTSPIHRAKFPRFVNGLSHRTDFPKKGNFSQIMANRPWAVNLVAVKRTVAGAFSASETLDVGVDLGSPVSFDYFDRAPFAFTGKIGAMTVDLK